MLSAGHVRWSMDLLQVNSQQGGESKRLASANVQGPRALYKGASIPAISWGITDSILMGRWVREAGQSLTVVCITIVPSSPPMDSQSGRLRRPGCLSWAIQLLEQWPVGQSESAS
jgi:hypothetical protein